MDSGTNLGHFLPLMSDTREKEMGNRSFLFKALLICFFPLLQQPLHVSVTTFITLRLSLSKHPEGRYLSPNHAEYQSQKLYLFSYIFYAILVIAQVHFPLHSGINLHSVWSGPKKKIKPQKRKRDSSDSTSSDCIFLISSSSRFPSCSSSSSGSSSATSPAQTKRTQPTSVVLSQ